MRMREPWDDLDPADLHDDDSDPDLEASLDDEFPLGDGVADLSSDAHCPYCGEPVEITLDPGSGNHQQYIEDCPVCCRPWLVSVSYDEAGAADVHLDANDDV
jgi:hypothetical protein